MTGTLSGHVNGQRLDGVRLSVVAITRSGRVDLMVRNPPASLAGSLLLVTPLNDVMSWMFGVTSDPGIPVGYEVMGETFTRNATLTFSSGNETAFGFRHWSILLFVRQRGNYMYLTSLTLVSVRCHVEIKFHLESKVSSPVTGNVPTHPFLEASPDPNLTLTQTLDLTQGRVGVARNRARSVLLV